MIDTQQLRALAARARAQCIRIKNATITGPNASSHTLECNIVPDPDAIACADALDALLADRDRLRAALIDARSVGVKGITVGANVLLDKIDAALKEIAP